MAEPNTTGEAIQVIRRALYDMAHGPGWDRNGATRDQIIGYCRVHKWPVPERDFDKAISRLHDAREVEIASSLVAGDMPDEPPTHWLTAQGDLAEEAARRGYFRQLLDEIKRPSVVVSFGLGLIGGWLLSLLTRL